MKNLSLFIEQAAKGLAPSDWWQSKNGNVQRLFYIKGGKGQMVDESGEKTEFIPGKVYIFPCNIRHKFETGSENRIDHIYFDFLSTPPIIAMKPLVYDVPAGGALEGLLNAADRLLPDRLPSGNRFDGFRKHDNIPRDFGHIPDAPTDSEDEYFQLIYSLLGTILTLLSYERELPLSNDSVINESLDLMQSRYREPLCIAKIAAEAGFEVNHFIRRFKKVIGVTPYAYLRSYRLSKARLFVGSGYTLAEIAEMVGYEDASSLSRALKTPRER